MDRNTVYRGYSRGGGIYQDVEPDTAARLAFFVYKNRPQQQLSVIIFSSRLRILLCTALQPHDRPMFHSSFNLDISTLLRNYVSLKACLELERAQRNNFDFCVAELKLLLCDLLLDRSVFDGFDLESLHNEGICSTSQWQDMQLWSTKRDLDELDHSFISASKKMEARVPNQLDLAIANGDLHVLRARLQRRKHPLDASYLATALKNDQLESFWLLLDHGAQVENLSL